MLDSVVRIYGIKTWLANQVSSSSFSLFLFALSLSPIELHFVVFVLVLLIRSV